MRLEVIKPVRHVLANAWKWTRPPTLVGNHFDRRADMYVASVERCRRPECDSLESQIEIINTLWSISLSTTLIHRHATTARVGAYQQFASLHTCNAAEENTRSRMAVKSGYHIQFLFVPDIKDIKRLTDPASRTCGVPGRRRASAAIWLCIQWTQCRWDHNL